MLFFKRDKKNVNKHKKIVFNRLIYFKISEEVYWLKKMLRKSKNFQILITWFVNCTNCNKIFFIKLNDF